MDAEDGLPQVTPPATGSLVNFIEELKFLAFPSQDFLQHKYLDHRLFTVVVSAFLALLWASLWVWDVVTDPVGAENTLGLRLLYLCALFLSVTLFFIRRTSVWLAIFFVVGMLAAEANFVLILNYLDAGMVYGIAGFMYCMFIAVLTLQCFSLRVNVIYVLSATLLPHVAGLLQIAHDFQHDHYAVLIWPAAMLVVVAQIVQSHHYLLRYRLEKELEKSSITDHLSGAKNRRYFMPLLEREIGKVRRTGQKLSVLMLDIDNFKKINDTYGHQTGDLAICNLSMMCQRVAREIDVVARLGGEEFTVLLSDCDQQQAVQVAERIRTSVAGLTMHSEDNQAFSYTVSIGVAELHHVDRVGRDFLFRADTALYEAKESGRNRVVLAKTIGNPTERYRPSARDGQQSHPAEKKSLGGFITG